MYIFFVLHEEKIYPVHELTGREPEIAFLLFPKIPEVVFIIEYFRMYCSGLFPFSTDLVPNHYDYVRIPEL